MSVHGPEKVRLTLEVSKDLNALLERLSEETGSSKSEVLRKAIGLMEVAVEAKQQGHVLGIADRDTPLRTRIVGI
jgi:predicted transcriptional regulator